MRSSEQRTANRIEPTGRPSGRDTTVVILSRPRNAAIGAAVRA